MSFWKRFFGTGEEPVEPPRTLASFLLEHDEAGDRLFVTARPNGRYLALALSPLQQHLNRYNQDAEDGGAVFFVEGESGLTIGEWHQGRSPELIYDSKKPVGQDPFDAGTSRVGKLYFTPPKEGVPFHKAYGLEWWSSADGRTLHTLLNYKTLPEARLIWKDIKPGGALPAQVEPAPDLKPFVGVWNRSHSVKGEIVRDPTEGCGFSVEGDEHWSEDILFWPDGKVVTTCHGYYRGKFEDGEIRWDTSAQGKPFEGLRGSSEQFRPFDGAPTLDGDKINVGGYVFNRVRDTQPD